MLVWPIFGVISASAWNYTSSSLAKSNHVIWYQKIISEMIVVSLVIEEGRGLSMNNCMLIEKKIELNHYQDRANFLLQLMKIASAPLNFVTWHLIACHSKINAT